MVNGIEEAFRPGTERERRDEAPRPNIPTGPMNYNEVIRQEQMGVAPQPGSTTPPPSAPPPPQKAPAEDLSGLY